ncbi:MAG: glycosyltransferase family 2 protein, partial [Thermoanaerobaculia bacterium]
MDQPGPTRRARPRVAAVVAAFNEAETLPGVLDALRRTAGVTEVILASDGSTDETVRIGRAAGACVLDLQPNGGKAFALAAGVAVTACPVLLFVDADLAHLDPRLLEDLIEPVAAGRVAMNVGIRHRGRLLDAAVTRCGPLLSGVRCLERAIFEAVPEPFLSGFQVETALNWVCRELGLPVETTVLRGVRHRVKEEKRGLWRGLRARLTMFSSVFAAYARLRFDPPPLAPP